MKEPVKGIEDNLILTDFQKPSSGNLENLRSRRYSGLNALSAFYLEHRFSEDLDFFSSEKVPFYIPEGFIKSLAFVKDATYTKLFDKNIFTFKLENGSFLKVEFTYYPLKNIEQPFLRNGILIDSFIDIV